MDRSDPIALQMTPLPPEPEIIQRTVAVNTADIITENANGRSHELVKKVGICHSIIRGADRLSGAGMHSLTIRCSELSRRPEYTNVSQKEIEQECLRRRRSISRPIPSGGLEKLASEAF